MEWPNWIWAASFDTNCFKRFLETFCEHTPCNKLCGSTNFIIFGPTYQKLWVFENFMRSLGRAGMRWSQLH
jgi:hypothetical protein